MGILKLLACAYLLINTAFAASLSENKDSQTMRRETLSASTRMQSVGPHGELREEPSQEALLETEEEIMRVKPSNKRHKTQADMCEFDFPLGRINTNNCSNETTHSLIMDGDMCRNAATQAGVGITDPLVVDIMKEEAYPLGCFRTECNASAKGLCYSYNSNGDWPFTPVGIPVCVRPRFLLGMANTNGQGADCPNGYELFDRGEQQCWNYAGCMTKEKGTPFRIDVANQTKYNQYPMGCYINRDPGSPHYNSVFYNEKFIEYAGVLPTDPVGIPICVVSSNTTWESAGDDQPASTAAYLDPIEHINIPSGDSDTAPAPAP